MSNDLKKLVATLEKVFVNRGSSLNAPAREKLKEQIDGLKAASDETDSAEVARLIVDALSVLSNLLVAVTNVMTMLR